MLDRGRSSAWVACSARLVWKRPASAKEMQYDSACACLSVMLTRIYLAETGTGVVLDVNKRRADQPLGRPFVPLDDDHR